MKGLIKTYLTTCLFLSLAKYFESYGQKGYLKFEFQVAVE